MALLNLNPLPDEAFTWVADVTTTNTNGTAVLNRVPSPNLTCQLPDGSSRPAQPGDVLSFNPDSLEGSTGHWEARPSQTAGGYEKVALNGNVAVYRPTYACVGVFAFLPNDPSRP